MKRRDEYLAAGPNQVATRVFVDTKYSLVDTFQKSFIETTFVETKMPLGRSTHQLLVPFYYIPFIILSISGVNRSYPKER